MGWKQRERNKARSYYLGEMLTSRIQGFSLLSSIMSNPNSSMAAVAMESERKKRGKGIFKPVI